MCILLLMQINLITVGNRMPTWIQQGYDEYAKRMPKACKLVLKEVMPGKRSKNCDLARLINAEGKRMIDAIPARTHVVSLDIQGKPWTTEDLSFCLERWMESGQDIALLIGGADGLSSSVRALVKQSWSLSKMTFPHPIVRILVAEQLYRAWSILNNHPYHK